MVQMWALAFPPIDGHFVRVSKERTLLLRDFHVWLHTITAGLGFITFLFFYSSFFLQSFRDPLPPGTIIPRTNEYTFDGQGFCFYMHFGTHICGHSLPLKYIHT